MRLRRGRGGRCAGRAARLTVVGGFEAQEVDVLALIDELDELLSSARGIPLSERVRVEREEVYALLDGIRAALPGAVKQARWVVKQRQELLAEARRECERLLGTARERAVREASAGAVERLAARQAEKLLAEARRVAHELRLEVDAWADGILALLEPNFEHFLRAIQRGREGLHERSSKESVVGSGAR